MMLLFSIAHCVVYGSKLSARLDRSGYSVALDGKQVMHGSTFAVHVNDEWYVAGADFGRNAKPKSLQFVNTTRSKGVDWQFGNYEVIALNWMVRSIITTGLLL
jgi:hypothetical protein